ncbi:DoxX family membrane protein [Tenacibaculum jejuense]|uniref:DoxX family protein n=1 Tax=Tenacibaculum jejuense TaxID=584609 RepID=A0A238U8L2_9FLAO|nr:DoxX family membrane protein [Tenacibaculum jejuense]SNR15533.1 DoxX family protein [Tenacibaculum jejuense]
MKKHLPLALKVLAGIIMLQTLFFKFTADMTSVDLFTKVAGENEAFMRIGTGIIELIATILLFLPKKTWLGALITVGVMSGAIFSHIIKIGIIHNNDGGALFIMAIITLISGGILLFLNKKDIPFLNF